MASDITLPGTGAIVETEEQDDGAHRQVMTLGEAINLLLSLIQNPMSVDPATSAVRVLLQAGAAAIGSVTIASGTVTTVGTLTTMSQIGAVAANGFIFDQMISAWANALRGRIT